jgi:hypothetical protein
MAAGAAMTIAVSAAATPPFPTLNIQLRFICLSLADSTSGALEAIPLDRLGPRSPRPVNVVMKWDPGTNASTTEISDDAGNKLNISEAIATNADCQSVPRDVFRFRHANNIRVAKFCLTGHQTPRVPFILIDMKLRANSHSNSDFLARLLAVSGCYPSRGLNVIYDGTSVDNEVVRSN